jgi:hypothetical protein
MTTAEKKLARDAARAIAKASIRGVALSSIAFPDGSAGLLIHWGSGPEPLDMLRELTPQLTAEVARRVLRQRHTVAAEHGDDAGGPAAA